MEIILFIIWGAFIILYKLRKDTKPLQSAYRVNDISEPQRNYNDRRFELVWRGKIFTPTEQKFFYFLKQAINTDKYYIFTKVRLVDVIHLRNAARDKYMTIFNQVSRKHLDFVITDTYWKIMCIIELDDKYHSKAQAVKNDKFKDDIFEYIGVPLERFRVGSYYDFKRLDNILV